MDIHTCKGLELQKPPIAHQEYTCISVHKHSCRRLICSQALAHEGFAGVFLYNYVYITMTDSHPMKDSSGTLLTMSLATSPPCLIIVMASECSMPSVELPFISRSSSPTCRTEGGRRGGEEEGGVSAILSFCTV